jgi:hypothetical protein
VPIASRRLRSRRNDERRSTVSGWWTVATTGSPSARDPQEAPAEALHVVHDVVALARAQARRERAQRAHAERERLGQEADVARAELVELERIERRVRGVGISARRSFENHLPQYWWLRTRFTLCANGIGSG